MKLVKLFFSGLLISLIGSLPLGTLNVATFKIAISSGQVQAFWFAIGCVIIEIVYVRVSLSAMSWVAKNDRILKLMTYFIFFITLALAIASFIAAFQADSDYHTEPLIKSPLNAFLLGVAMSSINPAQIPFWFGFSAVLLSRKILYPIRLHYGVYMAAIGIGSLLASLIFIYAGYFMIAGMGANHFTINIIVGACFTIAALFQFWRILFKKKTIK